MFSVVLVVSIGKKVESNTPEHSESVAKVAQKREKRPARASFLHLIRSYLQILYG